MRDSYRYLAAFTMLAGSMGAASPAFSQSIYQPLNSGSQTNNGYGATGGFGTGSNPASHYTQGYTTQNGTTVEPHYQTNPNSTTLDNYNTRGNYNPFNGRTGTRNPY